MFERLGTPAFVREGRETAHGAVSSAKSLLYFLLAFFGATMLEALLLIPFLVVALLSDDAFWELAASGAEQYAEAMEYTANLINTSPAVQVGSLLATAALAIAALVLCRKVERRSYLSMGLRRAGGRSALTLGTLIGLLLPFAAILFLLALGGARAEGVGGFHPLTLLFLFVGIVVKAFSEELFFRGCLFTSLARRGKLSVAIVVSSVVFAFLQRANAGFTPIAFVNLVLFGALCALCMVRSGSLWSSVLLHTLFLTCEVLVLGSPLCGMPASTSLLSFLFGEEQAFLHGGEFGLLGGFAMTFALCLSLAILGMKKTNEE